MTAGERLRQNQSLRYATHQLTQAMGMVAMSAQIRGRVKSANSPSRIKLIQKTFRGIA